MKGRIVKSLDIHGADVNVLTLRKGKESYVFVFRANQRDEVYNVFRRFAANPDLSFTWCDAACLSQKLRAE